ncbi:MAG: histidine phosphatase family protein [Leptospiraceae bacterium]|nr:histidine phosphatase family protein [Leptospiraceae bacterium]MCP5500923.1 histidine phosphatase family protein [Leptospiraceae bacterium]
MSKLYLIRHGSANSKGENYDMLSERGIQQSKFLSSYFESIHLNPSVVYSGSLKRQKDTAEISTSFLQQDVERKEFIGLNEITVELWRTVAESLSLTDASFADTLQTWLQVRSEGGKRVLLLFYNLTVKIVKAWKEKQVELGGLYSYEEFKSSCLSFLEELNHYSGKEDVVIAFSSGTPISILLSKFLQLGEERDLDWLPRIYNTSLSVIDYRDGKFTPYCINSISHIRTDNLINLI